MPTCLIWRVLWASFASPAQSGHRELVSICPFSAGSRHTPLFDRLFCAAIRGEGPIEEVTLNIAFEYASSMTLIERPAAGTPPFTKLLLRPISPPSTGKSVATALNSGRLAPVAVLSVEHGTDARRN